MKAQIRRLWLFSNIDKEDWPTSADNQSTRIGKEKYRYLIGNLFKCRGGGMGALPTSNNTQSTMIRYRNCICKEKGNGSELQVKIKVVA